MIDEIRLNEDLLITKYYSLYFPNLNTLVMSDFHIGFEEVMAEKGLLLPKVQTSEILDLLETVLDRYKPVHLIINGDFKHEFSKNVRQEWNEINTILDYLISRTKLTIVKGNHDNFLKNILAKKEIELVSQIELDKYLIVHGHQKIKFSRKFLVIGHEHPSIKIRDEVGGILTVPAFLFHPFSKILVLPSPSIYSSGSDILSSNPLSPLLETVDLTKFIVYGIAKELGLVYLGSVENIKDLYTFLM